MPRLPSWVGLVAAVGEKLPSRRRSHCVVTNVCEFVCPRQSCDRLATGPECTLPGAGHVVIEDGWMDGRYAAKCVFYLEGE